jgi:hypothetical protein
VSVLTEREPGTKDFWMLVSRPFPSDSNSAQVNVADKVRMNRHSSVFVPSGNI